MLFFSLFLLAAGLSFLLTPIFIRFAKQFGYLDLPNRPHPAILHHSPLPRGGGVPVLAAVLITFTVLLLTGVLPLSKALIGISLASTLVVIVGLLDDKYDLNPYLRLSTNIGAVCLVVGAGIGIASFTNPFGGHVFLDAWRIKFSIPDPFPLAGPHSILVWADIFALLWIVWIMNALNWSSGVDGQLSGIAVIGFVILGLISLRNLHDPTQVLAACLAFSAAGAYLGFLPFSFFPQKIMPGYGGSTLAGFLLATLSILAGAKLATAVLVLAVPLVDGAWAVVRRILKKKSPVWGDKGHLHHQLLARGWSIPKIALFYYSVSLALGLAALALDSQGKLFALVMVGVVILGVLITIGRQSYEKT
jgi:UDP-GlcNAc:undecaprenyl-phosphate GlcNAc-1-phosphate transferase